MAAVTEDARPSEAALAREISLARRDRRTLSAHRGALDMDAAYRIQHHRHDGLEVVGRKIDMVGAAAATQPGRSGPVHGPVHGPVLGEMLLEGPDIELARFLQPRLEPELAVVLAADLPADASPGEAARAVTGLFLAVDILDSVWDDYGFGIPEVVADGVNGGGFLLGEQLLPPDVAGELRLHLDGALVAAGSIAELGDPVTRVAWLAAEVGGLRARDTIFLGAPADDVPARPGSLLLEGPDGAVLSAVLRGTA